MNKTRIEHCNAARHKILCFAALLCCVAFSLFMSDRVQAQSAIVGQAYYEDASNALTFEEVKDKNFVPYRGIFTRGFSQSIFWFRLDLDPRQVISSPGGFDQSLFVLRILPSFLDEIEFFDPSRKVPKQRLTGTRFPGFDDELKSPNYHFVIDQLHEPRQVWVRLKTKSSNVIVFEVLRMPALTFAEQQQTFLYGLYFGVIFLTFLLALLIIKIDYDKIVLVFAIKQFATILWAFVDRGFYRLFFDVMPDPLALTITRLYISFFVVVSSIYFDYVLLKEFKSSKIGQRIQLALIGVIFITLFLYLNGYYALGIQINMATVFCAIISSWFIAVTLPGDALKNDDYTKSVPKYAIVLCYSIVFILLMPAVLPLLGITPATSLTLNSLLYHGLLSSIALATVLGLRARSIVVRQTELQGQLELSQRLAEEERQNRIEQSKFMAMLSHELKTPLAGIRMVAATEPIQATSYEQIANAVDDIDQIIERCLHAERILEGNLIVHDEPIDLADILQNLCRRHLQAARIKVEIDPLPPLQTDPRLLRVILSNLIDNACKYSALDTYVEVRAHIAIKNTKSYFEVIIDNEPIYQDWPDASKLFSKYYRSQIAHRVTGSGLGLYLVHQFTRMLNGQILYQPTETKVRFILSIPITV